MADEKPTVELEGTTYELRPLKTAGFLKLVEHCRRWKCKQYITSIADLRDVLPPDEWRVEWERALERGPWLPLTTDEVNQWGVTSEGLPYALMLMMRPEDAAHFTVERLRELVLQELDKHRDAVLALREANRPENNEGGEQ